MTDAHGVARDQLRAFIERIERLEEEKKTIADDIKDVYAEAKGMGFIPAMMKKVIALRKKDEQERMEEEAILDTYLLALGMIQADLFEEPHHPETGEIIDPKLAQTIVTGMQTEIGRKALIAAVDIMIAREEAEEEFHTNPEEEADAKGAATDDAEVRGEGDKDRQRSPEPGTTDGGRQGVREQEASAPVPASNSEMHERPSVNDKPCLKAVPQDAPSPAGTGSELLADREGRHEGEVAPADLPANSKTDAAISRPGIAFLGRPETENRSDKEAPEAGASGGMQDEIAIHPADPIAPAAQGEAEAPSVERVSPQAEEATTGSAAANAGGRHVNAQPHRAATAGALVQVAPATKPLRPHCRNPGEHCGGYGSNHCHACLRAAREPELEACT